MPTSRKSPVTTQPSSQRAKLLARAVQHVRAHGLINVSLRPLAKEIGTSHRMLIYHFGSKERLIIEIIREIRAEQRRALDELSLEGASPDEVLAGWWRYLIAEERRDMFGLCHEISALALREPERYREFLDEMVADWVTPIARILVLSGCPPDEAPARARATVAGVRGLMLDLRATGDQRGVDEAIRVLGSIVAFPKAPTNL